MHRIWKFFSRDLWPKNQIKFFTGGLCPIWLKILESNSELEFEIMKSYFWWRQTHKTLKNTRTLKIRAHSNFAIFDARLVIIINFQISSQMDFFQIFDISYKLRNLRERCGVINLRPIRFENLHNSFRNPDTSSGLHWIFNVFLKSPYIGDPC